MAKKKLNLDKDTINQFFIDHGEKLGFGAAIVIVGSLIWFFGLRAEMYQGTPPDELYQTAAQRAQNFITRGDSWEKIDEFRNADVSAAERIVENRGSIDPDDYLYGSLLGTITETLAKRTDPELFPPKDFQTKFIRAQIATKEEEAGPPERRLMNAINSLDNAADKRLLDYMKYWKFMYPPDSQGLSPESHLALTYDVVFGSAVMPHEKLVDEYRDKLKFAEGWHPVRDRPHYTFLQVQRSDDGGETWEELNIPQSQEEYEEYQEYWGKLQRFYDFFAAPAKEVIDPDYKEAALALGIPPILGYDYREIAGHAEVKFTQLVDEEEGELKEAAEGPSMFERDEDDSESTDEEAEEKSGRAPYRLVRFYDPTPKEVGKTYQYRVRAWVLDPNRPGINKTIGQEETGEGAGNNLSLGGGGGGAGRLGPGAGGGGGGGQPGGGSGDDQFSDIEGAEQPMVPIRKSMLTEEVRRRQRQGHALPDGILPESAIGQRLKMSIPTEWSEITEVTIPEKRAEFYAGQLRTPPTYDSNAQIEFSYPEQEASANLVAVSSLNDIEAPIPAKRERVYRGTALNFETVAYLLHPISWVVKKVSKYSGAEEVPEGADEDEGRYFETDAVVLDFMGGEKLPFSSSSSGIFHMPSEVVIMNSAGQIVVRNELQDETDYRLSTFQGDDPEPDADLEEEDDEEEDEDESDDNGLLGG